MIIYLNNKNDNLLLSNFVDFNSLSSSFCENYLRIDLYIILLVTLSSSVYKHVLSFEPHFLHVTTNDLYSL